MVPPLRGRHAHRASPEQRFWSRVSVEGSCWVWTGKLDRGYGWFTPGKGVKRIRAHRWSYETLTQTTLKDSEQLDHLCKNTPCVNPDHLEPVTLVENVMRGMSPIAINARKTHCVRGHEYTPENTYVRKNKPSNNRECRVCMRDYRKGIKNGDS